MSRRTQDWNEGLAKDLKNPKFAKEFLLSLIDNGASLQSALGKIIRAIGIKEFSKMAKMADSNIIRAIDPKYNPTQETLNRLLSPLGLRLTVTALNEKKAA